MFDDKRNTDTDSRMSRNFVFREREGKDNKRSRTIKESEICENNGVIPCFSSIYQNISMRLCKHHFMKYVKYQLRKEFRNLYRHADVAFGSMDMSGTG